MPSTHLSINAIVDCLQSSLTDLSLRPFLNENLRFLRNLHCSHTSPQLVCPIHNRRQASPSILATRPSRPLALGSSVFISTACGSLAFLARRVVRCILGDGRSTWDRKHPHAPPLAIPPPPVRSADERRRVVHQRPCRRVVRVVHRWVVRKKAWPEQHVDHVVQRLPFVPGV